MATRIAVLVLAVAFITACVRRPPDVAATFPTPADTSGGLDVVLDNPARGLSIAINDRLVVENKLTSRVRVTGVPAGSARVRVAYSGACQKSRSIDRSVEVIAGRDVIVEVPGPEVRTACKVYAALGALGGAAVGVLVIVLLL